MALYTFNGIGTINHHLVLIPIFSYLDMRDLRQLRMVCKGFRIAINFYKLTELELDQYEETQIQTKRNWFYTHRSFNLDSRSYLPYVPNSKKSHDYDLRHFNTKSTHLRFLKRLRLKSFSLNKSIITKLNELKCLETLEMERIIIDNRRLRCFRDPLEINLPELRYFSYPDSTVFLSLYAPKLIAVRVLEQGSVFFHQPESFTYLNIVRKTQNDVLFPDNFAHVRCFEITNLECDLMMINLATFKRLTKLKISWSPTYEFIRNLYQLFLNTIYLNENDLQFYYRNIRISNEFELQQVQNFPWSYDNCKNYANQVHVNEWVVSATYQGIRAIENDIKTGYFYKFKNIQSMCFNDLSDDSEYLTDIINGCKNLSNLAFVRCKLSQEFFNDLPSITSIRNLHIFDLKPKYFVNPIAVTRPIDRNYDFICRLHSLIYFSVNEENLIKAIRLDEREKLRKIDFLFLGNIISVEKIKIRNKYLYNVRLPSENIALNSLEYENLSSFHNTLKATVYFNRTSCRQLQQMLRMNVRLNIRLG